ncbi:MAG: MaoC family dehydratase [Haloarculaceae archaeon]
MTKYFEDIEEGEVTECGGRTVTKSEIIDFASRFDPQPFHVNEEAAAESMFGGIIASGWHTAALATRMIVDGWLGEVANEGGLGSDELRWHQPVTPGDTLRVRMEVLEKRDSESNPGSGIVRRQTEVLNQDDEVAMSWKTAIMVAKRDAE